MPADRDHIEVNETRVRKGTIAAFAHNALTLERTAVEGEEYARASADLRASVPVLQTAGMFEVFSVKPPRAARIVEEMTAAHRPGRAEAAAMRGVAVTEFGRPPQLMDLPRPVPGPGEVLVRLSAAGVNPFDLTIAHGLVKDRAPHVFPLILGIDGAGIVEEVGEGATTLAVGDAVYGAFLHPPYGKGTYAQYITVPENAWIAPAPKTVPLSHAAAAPTAGMTALALVGLANLTTNDGQSVLIVGAGGGVGSFAVQLAARGGARVIATAKPQSVPRLHALGASDCVDYTQAAVPELVGDIAPDGIHVLIDLVSDADSFAENIRLVRPGGHAISTRYAATAATQSLSAVDVVNLDLTGIHANVAQLDDLTKNIDTGQLRIDIQTTIALEQAPAIIASGHLAGARGKTIITIP
jgi:NADPH:quinone reductase-like Zn-dependent oxidoreductase